eukprot:CAMPEP_0116872236 /NCGR_PEP_ID=MMETSP0463-20121206/2947_1 /TAXON_ID=181622 /ORGANISM="Strombidinopsis sp, Strain SopsisLIS2011" /LENGTH=100 /DNA_ID=CAMNT_0004512177 /DNA_START=910 /DNA_END=1212 /DNA_ORIENTATION=-
MAKSEADYVREELADFLIFETRPMHDFTYEMLHNALNNLEKEMKVTKENTCVAIYFRGYCYVDEKNYAHVLLGNDELENEKTGPMKSYPLEQRLREFNKF